MLKSFVFTLLLLSLAVFAAGQVDEDFEDDPFGFWTPSAGNASPAPTLSSSFDHTYTPPNTSGHAAYMERNLIQKNAASGYLTSPYMQVIPTTVSMWVYNDSPTPGWGSSYVYVETSVDGITWTLAGDFHNGNINTWQTLTITVPPDANAHYIRIYVESNKEGMWYIDDISIDGGTLPVELSSFTVTASVTNQALLLWVTQSETGVAGFNIYRGTSDVLANAEMLNTFIEATNTSQQQSYIYVDEELWQSGTYYYWLESRDFDGANYFYGPVTFSLHPNDQQTPPVDLVTGIDGVYPNPFNPSTTIAYTLSQTEDVEILIFNVKGQVMRKLLSQTRQPGNYREMWDGLDNNGQTCSSGLYNVVLRAGNKTFNRMAVLLK